MEAGNGRIRLTGDRIRTLAAGALRIKAISISISLDMPHSAAFAESPLIGTIEPRARLHQWACSVLANPAEHLKKNPPLCVKHEANVPQWLLNSVSISGGFLSGLSLQLPPGLICIIGPRGSGKSTFAEAIRYGLLGAGVASKKRQDMVRANLAASVISLEALPCAEGQSGYRIRRSSESGGVLTTLEGAVVSGVVLDRGSFLPLDAYDDEEIQTIAMEDSGEKRRSLLDQLQADELREIEIKLTALRRDLDANSDAIKQTSSEISSLQERVEEIGDARSRFALLPPIASTKSELFLNASRQQQFNESERQILSELVNAVRNAAKLFDLDSFSQQLILPTIAAHQSQNRDLIDQAQQAYDLALKEIGVLLSSAQSVAKKAEDDLIAVKQALSKRHEEQNKALIAHQKDNEQTAELVRNRSAAEKLVSLLDQLEQKLAFEKRKLNVLYGERQTLKATFLLERDRVSALRENAARRLTNEVGGNIRLRVLRNADTHKYQEKLLNALRGARLRNHDEIVVALLRLRPEQLAQTIRDLDFEELDRATSLGQERCKKILSSFCQELDPQLLEIEPINDQVCIELNVASQSTPAIFKDASELSRGQRCTAILPVLLARRACPLIIDQPEDNLDNHFIFETVVDSIRRLKSQRQMIFITHNANIPVLADADLVVVMDSNGKQGYVTKTGTVDQCKEEIIDLLEGGKTAFQLRRRRYGDD